MMHRAFQLINLLQYAHDNSDMNALPRKSRIISLSDKDKT
jgi:hypothetical protein